MTINYKFNKSSEARDCVVTNIEITTPDKSFTASNPNWVKSYFENNSQETIEFVTDNPLDEVILKEWLGEWEEILCPIPYTIMANINFQEKLFDKKLKPILTKLEIDEIKNILSLKVKQKKGSPKLNSNWTFKINI